MPRKKAPAPLLQSTNGLDAPEKAVSGKPGGYLVYFAVPAVAVKHIHVKDVASAAEAEAKAWQILKKSLPILGLSTFTAQGDVSQIKVDRVVKHSEAENQDIRHVFRAGKSE